MAETIARQKRREVYNRLQSIAMPIVTSWLILLASFVNFLRYNNYPLLRPEIALIATAMLALAGGIGLLHRSQRPLGQAILDALLVFLIVNQNGGELIYSAVAAAVAAGATLHRRRSILPLLGFAAAVALAAGLIGIGQQHGANAERGEHLPAQSGTSRPALLHIVLDEHLGVEGFAHNGADGKAVERQLKGFYLSHGFRLFGRAYAEQFRTVNSIPQILNFGDVLKPDAVPFDGEALNRDAYFDALSAQGYKIDVYQADYLDYCGNHAVSHCLTYDFSGLNALDGSSLSTMDRAIIIMSRFSLLSSVAIGLEGLYIDTGRALDKRGIALPELGLLTGGRTTPLSAVGAFDRLIEDLRHAEPGDAYFAHILLPHDPYELDADCTPRPMASWQLHDPQPDVTKRQAAYDAQVRCALSKVDAAYAALSRSSAGRNFIMIVHGDHGSRITKIDPTIENLGKFDSEDLIAGFSTLFAIRAPGITPGYDDRVVAVPYLLKNLAQSKFTIIPRQSKPPQVILNDSGWIPRRRVALPMSW